MRFLLFVLTLFPIYYLKILGSTVNAQVVPDGTLRNNSTVNFAGAQWNITGGETLGNNLFHSFSTFNVGTGETAFFNNAATLQNIIARVTGGTSSTIDGLIRANGGANLFLINPSGILFGANAQLNIGGSFFASTAESVTFSDGSSFSATNPQAPPLLAVNVPMGLQMGTNPGNITVNAQNLQVLPGRTLGFIGGNLQLNNAQVRASQGRIELGSVGANSLVRLTPNNANIAASYEGVSNFKDIQLSNTTVDASGLGGGTIQVQGRHIAIGNSSQVLTRTLGSQAGGELTLRGSESVTIASTDLLNPTIVANDTVGSGAGGNLTIETGQFMLQGTAFLSSSTFGSGNGGNLTIRASERAILTGVGFPLLEQFLAGALSGQLRPTDRIGGLFAVTSGSGAGGDINIETGSLAFQNGSMAATATFGDASSGNLNIRATHAVEIVSSALVSPTTLGVQGSAGNMSINASQVTIRDGSTVSSATLGEGRGGDIEIIASDFVDISSTPSGALLPTGITNNSIFGTGAGGDVRVATGRLRIREGGTILTNSGAVIATGIIPFGGPGGDIEIDATESVEIAGGIVGNVAGQPGAVLTSGPGTTTFTSSPAGDLTIRTRRLIIADGASATSATLSSGNAGNLTVEASESVELIGTSSLDALPTSLVTSSGRSDLPMLTATGNGGNITLKTGALVVRDGATIDVRSLGVGDAGTLDISANSIFLDRGSSLNASTVSGAGGNILLDANLILLRRGSNITTDAGDTDGGNIIINAGNLVAILTEDSDISANSRNSRGGNVTINVSGGIFGLRFREEDTPFSDITATGRDSSQSGTVTINTLEINPAEGLEQLAQDIADPSNQIATGCAAYAQSRLTVTGRGGVPDNPTVTLRGQTVWRDMQEFSSDATNPQTSVLPQEIKTTRPLVEATNWRVNEAGNIELIAVSPQESSLVKTLNCQDAFISERS
ncbi:filamentous hemagglutinin N-terminal domain-containing protein [Lusitaniella coriacea]|uniref:two-partner secretion domain-containing protein n=1 Tax=Lusitaniella coriacea TaxID=1983105 RepID=UPI003CE7A97D